MPDPAQDQDGVYLHTLKDKPATVVNRLPGKSALAPTSAHCGAVGAMLARMHLAASDFALDAAQSARPCPGGTRPRR